MQEHYISKAEFARKLGRSRSQITRYCQSGLPQANDGSIPLQQAREWLRENYASHADQADGSTLAGKKAEKLDWEIERIRLEVEQARGTLVDRERAERQAFDLARQIAQAWQSWPARVAPDLAAELGCDPATVEKALRQRVNQQLAEMSASLRGATE